MTYSLTYSTLLKRYPTLESCEESIVKSIKLIHECFLNGHKVIAFGNGGSSADAEHFCGELQKSFIKDRPLTKEVKEKLGDANPLLSENLEMGLPAIALSGMHSSLTAISNDIKFDFVFAQQTMALSKPGDVIIGFSTSGTSLNVVHGIETAKALGLKTISFTGMSESPLSKMSDVTIQAPESITHLIQELHLPIYHAICMEIENLLF